MSHNRVSEILSEFLELKKATKNLVAEGHPHTDIAIRGNMNKLNLALVKLYPPAVSLLTKQRK